VFMAAFIGIAVALVAVFLALLVPLLPFAFLAFCVWAVVRRAARPALTA